MLGIDLNTGLVIDHISQKIEFQLQLIATHVNFFDVSIKGYKGCTIKKETYDLH